MAIKSIKEIKNLNGKKVLVRCDFDVPVKNGGQIADITRIKACIPTINYLIQNNAKVALLTKIGRPNKFERISTKVLIPTLESLLSTKVIWLPTCIGENVLSPLSSLGNLGKVILFENVRFNPQEEKGNEKFAKELAKPYDLFVNEAFAVCHRKDASVSVVPKYLPSYGGFRLIEEVKTLTELLKNPQRPFIAIIGGAKAETKIPVIKNLAKIADKVLVGGKIAFELPSNLPSSPKVLTTVDDINGKDIGPNTVELFANEIEKAKTVVWNGPMGMFETPPYNIGTNKIAKAISESQSRKVIGGGDTITSISKTKLLGKIDFISTGGGAMLTLLSGQPLPGINALIKDS